jgi:hypothetical protein
MNKRIFALGGTAIAMASLALATSTTASAPSERRAKQLAAYEPSGKPISCIRLTDIRNTNIIDNRTIDFHVGGKKVYRNVLPHSCPSLVSEDRFSYRTSLSQLCSVDIIRVLHNYGGGLQEGAGCGLGKFQPMTKVTPAK